VVFYRYSELWLLENQFSRTYMPMHLIYKILFSRQAVFLSHTRVLGSLNPFCDDLKLELTVRLLHVYGSNNPQ
jgi:hypothetical protein